jgi:Lon protease-like protein
MDTVDGLIVFPLPEVALFPHALVPLHLFEPRYRAMARDCLASTRQLALATLAPGFEADYDGRPPWNPLCGMGEIVAHHRHADGRFDILVRGTQRVRLEVELAAGDEPYRRARAAVLGDAYRPGVDLALARQALLALCDRLAEVLPTGGDTLRALARQEEDPAATVDVLAAALVTDPARRQALIVERDVLARLDAVTAAVASVLARLRERGGASSLN